MPKQRIYIYIDPETKRRIEFAAAKHNMSVSQYCLNAIEQRLADDDLLEQKKITIPVTPDRVDDTLIADLRALREAILADRGGKLIDIDGIIEEMRAERDDDIIGLR